MAFMLSRMRYPDFPEPLGVFRAVEKFGAGDLQKLVTGEETWTVS